MTPRATDSMLRRGARLILRSVRAHPLYHAIAMIGALGFVLAAVAGTWVLRWVTDDVVIPALDDGTVDRGDVWAAMAAILGVSAARGLSTMTRRWFLATAEARTQRDWRQLLLGRYLDLPLDFHRSRSAGELLAHADTDVQTATMVLKPLAFSVSVVLLVVVAVVSLLVVHPLLGLIALVLFPALAVMSRVYTRLVEAPAAAAQHEVGVVSSVAHESFDGALVVKTLGREAEEVERLRAAADDLRRQRIQVGRLRGSFEPLIDALPNVGIILVLLVGAWLVSRDAASPGDLVLAASLFTILGMPLRVVGFFLEELPRSVVALDRVDRVLDLPVEPRTAAGVLESDLVGLEVDDVVVRHGDHVVLDGVTMGVDPGETVALVGATGSGKSTLLEAIAGLVDTHSGTIRLDGRPLPTIAEDEMRATVALVFQETFLFADTIDENVTLAGGGRAGDADTIAAALAIAHADGFVDELVHGRSTVVGERGVTLSGGQRQRIALARALARTPRLLMLDDATSAVDPKVEGEILENLRHGAATTLLVVAHRTSTIRLADRVVYLDEGRIVASGRHDELLERPDYRALVTAYEQAERR